MAPCSLFPRLWQRPLAWPTLEVWMLRQARQQSRSKATLLLGWQNGEGTAVSDASYVVQGPCCFTHTQPLLASLRHRIPGEDT